MDWSWLVVLACPLMMLPMFFFMMKGNKSDKSNANEQSTMQMEIEQLKKQNQVMQDALEQMTQKKGESF